MANPWDKRPKERGPSYKRFKEFLELGPKRTVTELARRSGVSPQALSRMARDHDWKSRAKAYDIAHGLTTEVNSPPPPPPPRPPRKPPPPPPIDPSQPIEPEVVGAILASDKAQEEIDGLSEYRKTFEPVGRIQLSQALRSADTIDIAHGLIMEIIPLWIKALQHTGSEDPDIRAAAMQRCDFYSKQSLAAGNMYWKTAETEVRLAGGDALTILGNCAGVQQLLNEAFSQQAAK